MKNFSYTGGIFSLRLFPIKYSVFKLYEHILTLFSILAKTLKTLKEQLAKLLDKNGT